MNKNIPQIARVTHFDSGENIQIFGENLDDTCSVYMWRSIAKENTDILECKTPDECIAPPLPPEDALEYQIDKASDGQVIFFGESRPYPLSGVSALWVKNSEGFSKPYIVNKPQIWISSLNQIYPGGKVTVCGVNFFSKRNVKAVIKNKASGEYTPLNFLLPDCYAFDIHNFRADFMIPSCVKDGVYELYLHCGSGSELGWSNGIELKIKSELSVTDYYRLKWNRQANENLDLPKCEIIYVEPEKLGAFADCYSKIQEAVDLLKDKGGIVLLDAGTYAISRGITLHDGVVLQGAGNGATVLRATQTGKFEFDWSDVAFATRKNGTNRWAADWRPHILKYDTAPLVRIYNNAGIDGINLKLGDGADVGVLVASKSQEPCFGAFINDCVMDEGNQLSYQVDNVFGAEGAGILCVSHSDELTVYNNRITTFVPISILPAKNFHLKCIKNHFEHFPRQMKETYFCGIYESFIEQNTFVGGRRSMMVQDGFENNFIYQNRSLDVARSENALEVYMAENGSCEWCGKAVNVGRDYIEVDYNLDILGLGIALNERLDEYNYYLTIIDGRGLGQYGKVIKTEQNKIYLQNDFDILPDETTVFSLGKATVNNLWVDNNSTLSNGHSQFIWICGLENVIAGHACDLAGGIRLYAHFLPQEGELTDRLCPVAFNQITLCQMRSSGKGIFIESGYFYKAHIVEKYHTIDAFERTLGNFGNKISRNVTDGSPGLMYTKNQSAWLKPHSKASIAIAGNYNVVCKNRILGCKYAIDIMNEKQDNYFSNNVFEEDCVKFIGNGKPIGNDA